MTTRVNIKVSNGLKRLRFAGFTLVELLVVIAIIALLVSILLPALSRAKEQARMVICQTQLRAIGQAIYTYAQDDSENRTMSSQTNGVFIQYNYVPVNLGILLAKDYLPLPSSNEKNVIYCPGNPDAPGRYRSSLIPGWDFVHNWDNPVGSGQVLINYLWRDGLDGIDRGVVPDPAAPSPGVPVDEIAHYPILTDQPTVAPVAFHFGKMQFAFGDTHTEWVDLNVGKGRLIIDAASLGVTGNTYFLWFDDYYGVERFDYPGPGTTVIPQRLW